MPEKSVKFQRQSFDWVWRRPSMQHCHPEVARQPDGAICNILQIGPPPKVSMLIDKGLHGFRLRWNSAFAENALASLRISLARRSSSTSRFSASRRLPSDVLARSARHYQYSSASLQYLRRRMPSG